MCMVTSCVCGWWRHVCVEGDVMCVWWCHVEYYPLSELMSWGWRHVMTSHTHTCVPKCILAMQIRCDHWNEMSEKISKIFKEHIHKITHRWHHTHTPPPTQPNHKHTFSPLFPSLSFPFPSLPYIGSFQISKEKTSYNDAHNEIKHINEKHHIMTHTMR